MRERWGTRAIAFLSGGARLFAVLAALAGIAFLLHGIFARPYTEIEAQLIFHANRIRAHLPLYVDPRVGAWDMGAPPSRYYVTYPPAWAWLLAHFCPASSVATRSLGRAVNVVLFLSILVNVSRGARLPNRGAVLTGALLVLGLHMLVREAGLAQADVPALALVAFGTLRANKRGEMDAWCGALIGAAPLVKPNALGAGVGLMLAHLYLNRNRGWRTLAPPFVGIAAVGASLICMYHTCSGGQWLVHVARATGQSVSFARWKHEAGSRVLLLGLPHLVVLGLAVRRKAPLLAIAPLAASIAWTTFTLAKLGSATHYWLEPSVVALVTLGQLPLRKSEPFAAAASFALSIAVCASSLPPFARAPSAWREWPRIIADTRRACGDGVVMASDVRFEMELNGRPIVPAWESAHMARAGTFPLDAWRADLLRPEVTCVVTDGVFFDPLPEGHDLVEVGAYRRELRPALESAFAPGPRVGPYLVFTRRRGTE